MLRVLEDIRKLKLKDQEGKEGSKPEASSSAAVSSSASGSETEPLSNSLARLCLKQDLSDVKFVVGAERTEIYAHRLILASASPVLQAMLYPHPLLSYNNNNNNNNNNFMLAINVPDVEVDIFRSLLLCIYKGKVDISLENLEPLIAVVQKYQVSKLANACVNFLLNEINASNACELLKIAHQIGNVAPVLNFITSNADEVFKTPGFINLEREYLRQIISAESASIAEKEVFQYVLNWAKARLEEKKCSDDPQSIRNELGDLLFLIRFPSFTVNHFATQVLPTNILTQEEALEVFAYMGSRNLPTANRPKTRFAMRRRKGGMSLLFEWKLIGSRLQAENQRRLLRSNGAVGSAIGDIAIMPKTGTKYWEIRIDTISDPTAGAQVGIGVATAMLPLEGQLSSFSKGWSYYNNQTRTHNNTTFYAYGRQFRVGDVIGVLLNTDSGRLYFYQDNKRIGLAFSGVNEMVYPAVSLSAGVIVSVIDPEVEPDDALDE